jgi:hypothetical protein
LQCLSQLYSVRFSSLGKNVECFIAEVVVSGRGEERTIKKTLMLKLVQVDDVVPILVQPTALFVLGLTKIPKGMFSSGKSVSAS